MVKTKVTELLGIQYPIIQGGMMWVSTADLAAAVSNAGGLGVITALTFETPEALGKEIDRMRSLTDKPFAVNMTFLPSLRPIPYEGYFKIIMEKRVKILETAGRNPEPFMPLIKSAGIKVIHKCTSVRHAKKAEAIGCDAVSIDGFECAGHPGEDDVPGLVLIPRAAEELNVPIIASGGIGDGRGMAAALALGADGVNMGTRFLATKEAPVHDAMKQMLVDATEVNTRLVERSLKNTVRVMDNAHARKIQEMEDNGAGLEELAPLMSGLLGKKAIETGELDGALLAAGQVAGLIHDIPTVDELIQKMVADMKAVVQERLGSMI